ncbi:putative ribonuclease H-like domain-containing protein [Tanacetum coccineum]
MDGKTPVGFDKKKLECFNCHNTGHFTRECTVKGTHDGNKKIDSFYQHQEAEKQEKNQMGLLTMDDGIVNWGEHTEVKETNHALMAISSSNEANEIYEKNEKLKRYRRVGMKAVKEKEQLQKTFDSWSDSSKNLWMIINSWHEFKGPQEPEPNVSDDSSSEYSTCQSNDSAGSIGTSFEHLVDPESEISSVTPEVYVSTPITTNEKVWTNAKQGIYANKLVPRSVQLNAGRPNINSGRTNINSVRPNINTGRTNINHVRPRVNTGSSNVNTIRTRQSVPTKTSNSFSSKRPQGFGVKASAGYNWRNSNPNSNCDSGPTFIRTDHPLKNMVDRGIFDSGCSGHMTGNKDQLEDFKEFNGDMLPLEVPRHHNMYSFDMKTPTPAKGFACLIAKATSNESKLWHRRLGASEVTNSAGTSQTLSFNVSEGKDEDVELIVVPSNREEFEENTSSVNTGSEPVNTSSFDPDDSLMPELEIFHKSETGIFDEASYDEEGVITDFNSLPTEIELGIKPMQEELLQFKLQQVWVLVDLPHGMKQEGRYWTYDEVFAHVARKEAIRLFLTFASFIGFIVYQMDVKSAFLYDTIDEEFYVSQPPGFVDRDHPKKVYKVVKALYGLHQAPRAWYATLSTFLEKHGYKRGTIDKTLFIKRDKKDIMLVQVYVDDIIFGSTKKSWCDEFEALMKSRFQMSSMGELTFFLGLQVKQNKAGIFISQDKYVAEILKKFDLVNVKTAITPMETKVALTKDEEAVDVDVTPKTSHLPNDMSGIFKYLRAKTIFWAYGDCMRKKLISVEKIHTDLNVADLLTKLFDGPRFNYLVSKQFSQTAMPTPLLDGTLELQETIDTIVYTITEASIRNKLQLADASGITMLPNIEIFKGMRHMGYPTDGSFTFWKSFFTPQWRFLVHHLLHCISSKSGGWDQFGSNIATALICLSTGRVYNFSKLIFDGMVANLKSKTKFLMYPRFLQLILEIQTENKHTYLAVTLTKKIFGNMKRGFRGVPRPLLPAMLLVANPNAGQAHPDVAPSQPSSSTIPVPSTSLPPVQSPQPITTPIPASTPTPIPETSERKKPMDQRGKVKMDPLVSFGTRDGYSLLKTNVKHLGGNKLKDISHTTLEGSLKLSLGLLLKSQKEVSTGAEGVNLAEGVNTDSIKLDGATKKRKAQVQFEAQHYTDEDWDLIRAKIEANAEFSKSVLGSDLQEKTLQGKMAGETYMMRLLKESGHGSYPAEEFELKNVKEEFDKLGDSSRNFKQKTSKRHKVWRSAKGMCLPKKTGKRRVQNIIFNLSCGYKPPVMPIIRSASKEKRRCVVLYQIVREDGTDIVYINFGAMLKDLY